MSANKQPTRPIGRGPLIGWTLAALVVAVLIVLGAILPAEFNRDPLGVGRLSGLSRLWAPEDRKLDIKGGTAALAHEYDAPFRTDVVEIPLGKVSDGALAAALEYKVAMKKDAALIYSWTVEGATDPRDFTYDQHGHTLPKGGDPMTVATYKQTFGLRQQGALTAPFDGIQGWLFANGGDRPVVVKLRLAGFYELIPQGQPGNEAGIIANVPAAQSRPWAPRPHP